MKYIPLNSLVILVDADQAGVLSVFDHSEIVTHQGIRASLGIDHSRRDLDALIRDEIDRLVFIRLSLGQRVVLDIPGLSVEERHFFAKKASTLGFQPIYLTADLAKRRDLLNGDKVAYVVDQSREVRVVRPIENDFFAGIKSRGYDGVTVVADVHGMMPALQNAVTWARSRNHFLFFLGDIVDYGAESAEVANEVYKLWQHGHAEALMGNHERKIFRYFHQLATLGLSRVRLSEGNQVTVDKVESMSKPDRDRWVSRFMAMCNAMRTHRVDGDFIFAHGAVKPGMWSIQDHRLPRGLEEAALFGEVDDSKKVPGAPPNRVYNWVDLLTENQCAIVGHDVRSQFDPYIHKGERGGKAIFLDTGCGKTGHLSTVDIRFTQQGVKVENFNFH